MIFSGYPLFFVVACRSELSSQKHVLTPHLPFFFSHSPPLWIILNRKSNRWARIPFRLAASIPPIILGVLIRELGLITDYAGTAGFIIGFTIPGLLFIRSQRIAQRKGFSLSTYYSSYASSIPLAFALAVFGIAMLIYVMSDLLFF